MRPELYVDWVLQEIRNRHGMWTDSKVNTLYFGGGTPSLLSPALIVAIYRELANVGFQFSSDSEITLEINPATLTEENLVSYMNAGFNRFSVGAQTFDDQLLKMCGRRHNAADTRETLRLLQKYSLNYSFDLLFALPGQTLEGVKLDLGEVLQFSPPHLSAYCLTVPEGHAMSVGRPPEDEQVKMFAEIETQLKTINLHKYEISNFSKPGFESRHNLSYWTDRNYWGLGLSSHSYNQAHPDFGLRFWNPKSLKEYGQQVLLTGDSFLQILPEDQREALAPHESLTDFCHMFLRMQNGLSTEALRNKFGAKASEVAEARIADLLKNGLLEQNLERVCLSQAGQLISNRVFEKLTFLEGEIDSSGLTEKRLNSYCSV